LQFFAEERDGGEDQEDGAGELMIIIINQIPFIF
jgi:hypothetical protein